MQRVKMQSTNDRLERELATLRREVCQKEQELARSANTNTTNNHSNPRLATSPKKQGNNSAAVDERENNRIAHFLKQKARFAEEDEGYGDEDDEDDTAY